MKDVCIAAAQAGAKVLRDLYDRPRDIHLKGRIDLVTDADKASEETVLKTLARLAPGVKVLAEESGEHGRGEARFIVDPLDGTTNYAHGIPIFCCTVAFEENGRVQSGCTVDPLRDEVFHASRGEGAWLGAKKLHVSSAQALEQAVMCTGFPYTHRERLPQMMAAFNRFTELARGTRRLGSAALDLAYVAAGRLDGFWEIGLAPWDVAAGQVLVEEAGGVVTRFDGSPLTLDGREIAASGRSLHAAILAVVTSGSPTPAAR
jgi:myo-inositol-1(or 4)-monophosphatase